MSEQIERLETSHPLLLFPQKIPAWYRYGLKPAYLLLSPVIVPVKLLLAIAFVAVKAIADFLLDLGTDPDKPLPRWRQWVFKLVTQITYRGAMLSLGIVPLTRGKANPKVQTVCFNHQSAMDLTAAAVAGIYSGISKVGVSKNPLFASTLRASRSFLARAGNDLDRLAKRLTDPGYDPIGVCPGGTTTNQLVQPRFRTGIFHQKPTVQIATLKYYSFENVYYVAVSGPRHILNVLLNPLSFVVVTFHPEVLSYKEGETPQGYADRVGAAIAQKTGGVYTNYTFKDCLWFCGHEQLEPELSEDYKRDHLWRGNVRQWAVRCRKAGLDPRFNWTRAQLAAREK